jgi:pyrroloquinoline quinone biosynthesis protein B
LREKLLYFFIAFSLFLSACKEKNASSPNVKKEDLPDQFIVILGIAQDAGYPQIRCEKECCKNYWNGSEEKKHITSLALVDRRINEYWLFEATPDITTQLQQAQSYLKDSIKRDPSGVFITHAHIGHYSGLLQFGREAMGSQSIEVSTMPRMDSFLRNNAPWSQLVKLENIKLNKMDSGWTYKFPGGYTVTPVQVPHRDEFSETAGFVIASKQRSILFIPDIDKWEKWGKNIIEEVGKVDIALLDGTFYKNGELHGRDMREVPHPFVEETMKLFGSAPDSIRQRVVFIHFNHTNPLLKKNSTEKEHVKRWGFGVAEEGMIIQL